VLISLLWYHYYWQSTGSLLQMPSVVKCLLTEPDIHTVQWPYNVRATIVRSYEPHSCETRLCARVWLTWSHGSQQSLCHWQVCGRPVFRRIGESGPIQVRAPCLRSGCGTACGSRATATTNTGLALSTSVRTGERHCAMCTYKLSANCI